MRSEDALPFPLDQARSQILSMNVSQKRSTIKQWTVTRTFSWQSQKTNDFDTTHPQQNETDSATGRVLCPPLELLFPVRTRACVARGARVGGSGQSSTLLFGLPWIAKASSQRRDTFLPLLHLIFEGQLSPGSPGAQPLFSADEKREHERSRGTASPGFVACGRHAGDTDQNSTVWAGVP